MDADLKRLLTQLSDKLDRMATKDDIAQMATKDDIANMATKDDIDALRAEMKAGDDALRAEMKAGFDAVAARFDALEKLTDIAEIRGRLEEQSKMLQLALGGRMSRPPAA